MHFSKDFKLLFDLFLNPDLGTYGEALTETRLRVLNLFGKKGMILRNIYLPKTDGTTSEIDLVFITQKGIFVMESKNYSGWIFGRESDPYWTQSLPNRTKYRFYNPIWQNDSHIKWLRCFLSQDVPMFSFIVFSERCTLKDVSYQKERVNVLHRDELGYAMRSVWKAAPDQLTMEQIRHIYEKLLPLTNVDATVRQAHIDAIQKQFSHEQSAKVQPAIVVTETNPDPETSPYQESVALFCPKCGAKLVLRTARKGANAGNQFYGCSAFPKCRYIQNF